MTTATAATAEPTASDARAIDAAVECGWGRLVFGQSFADPAALVDVMRAESPGRRDIAFYIADPHVVLAAAPHELFLDPSHTFRLDLEGYRPPEAPPAAFEIRDLAGNADVDAVNRIYGARSMMTIPPHLFDRMAAENVVTVLVAVDAAGQVLGTVMGVDHAAAFGDPEKGSSLWCLAVDPQAPAPGVGAGLVHALASLYAARGAAFMDLSVMHDNAEAIALYEKIGFARVPYFTLKRKNSFNEKLFTGPVPEAELNPYARLIVDEARRRGIDVEVTDAEGGFFRLSYGGRAIMCRESLTDLTSAIAVSICDDKAVTRRVVERAGLVVPAQIEADDAAARAAFLAEHGAVVVKPARGEQGRGVAVGIDSPEALEAAVDVARRVCDRVIVESCAEGEDLRLVVIDYKVVAAAIRRPPRVFGDGRSAIRELIERQSRRRAAATGGESTIPLDVETERCVARSGLGLDDVAPEGAEIVVRRTANLHTGGTIHDVTDIVHPVLIDAAVKAAKSIQIPVTGIDLLVKAPDKPDYVFIEANERPGLANHEPQPTAARFIDLLFPQSMPMAARLAERRAEGMRN
ncbi:N-acetylglutaminylglutamine synthetase [Methylobrevis albus]|uniref:N-acetylglutaminylglutamine synthetase n=1 Tax=Methylobrevis albus TaxID=2793297 RepID=A0A931HZW9_9HYPH|nr:N-acetylglutaminylglutamine synthetase [Methylobrevis albus]MBH0236428.1 N-acetylglutaminylglutamine synthetase [Methylobrevis albus]